MLGVKYKSKQDLSRGKILIVRSKSSPNTFKPSFPRLHGLYQAHPTRPRFLLNSRRLRLRCNCSVHSRMYISIATVLRSSSAWTYITSHLSRSPFLTRRKWQRRDCNSKVSSQKTAEREYTRTRLTSGQRLG